MSDKDDLIVVGVNQKDKKIWRDFYDRYYAALCSYVEKILFLSDAVEDLVQEVFISVWEGKRTFSDSRELTNYLYRACYNNALLYIRNHQIHDSILNGLPQEEDFEDEEMLYALTVKEEAIRQLYRGTSCRTTPHHPAENRGTFVGRNRIPAGSQHQYG